MLKLLRKSLALELHSFYAGIGKMFQKITASALVQNRYKIKPALFYDLNKTIALDFYLDNDENVKLYKKHRLLAVDGSTVNLPVNENTIEHYGLHNNHIQSNDVVLARVSVLYDVLNNMVLDGYLCNQKTGEIKLLHSHLPFLQKNDLLLLDRCYPSFENCYLILKRQAHFLFRCKIKHNKVTEQFYNSGKKQLVTTIKPRQNSDFKNLPYQKDEKVKVRLIRIELESGETEILMTSLLNKSKHKFEEFKDLYFQRWAVETFYDRFKNIIEVERFSGKNHQFIQQEFNCALYVSNMQSIFTQDVEVEKQIALKHKNSKYQYKVNQSLSLGFIRDSILKIFTSKQESKTQLEMLKELFVLHVVPIRPNRKFERKIGKYNSRTKPIQFDNKRIVL